MTEEDLYRAADGARIACVGMYRCENPFCDQLVPLMTIQERNVEGDLMRLCRECAEEV